ncbi:MAG: hypothetical protein AB7O62_10130, partial [Pirellulales bacterium]
MNRADAFYRLEEVAGEHAAATVSIAAFRTALAQSPALLANTRLEQADFARLSNNLELTFLVRPFARFEGVLRDYWLAKIRPSKPVMEILVDRIADRLAIPSAWVDDVHHVREIRNDFIHHDMAATMIGFDEAKSRS